MPRVPISGRDRYSRQLQIQIQAPLGYRCVAESAGNPTDMLLYGAGVKIGCDGFRIPPTAYHVAHKFRPGAAEDMKLRGPDGNWPDGALPDGNVASSAPATG